MRNSQRIAYIRLSNIDDCFGEQLSNMTFDKIFEEKTDRISSKKTVLNELITYCQKGDHIYIHRMGILAGNFKELLSTVKKLTDKGCSIHFVKHNLNFTNNDNSPQSKILMQVLSGLLEFESDCLRAKILEGLAAAKEKGSSKIGRPILMTEEKKKYCHEKIKQGCSLTSIAKDLGVSRMTIYREIRKNINT